jgi:hypothetical protein
MPTEDDGLGFIYPQPCWQEASVDIDKWQTIVDKSCWQEDDGSPTRKKTSNPHTPSKLIMLHTHWISGSEDLKQTQD